MADENNPNTTVSDTDEARAKAFFGDTVDTLQAASAEGWDAERTGEALTDVQRSHGYWSDTPVLGGALRRVGLGLSALALATCTEMISDNQTDFEAYPDMVYISGISLDPQQESSDPTGYTFIYTATENAKINGRSCCSIADASFDIDFHGPKDGSLKVEDVAEKVGEKANFFLITVPDKAQARIVEPLFGESIKYHTMKEPQNGCEVASGIRDGQLRVGVVAYRTDIEPAYTYNGREKSSGINGRAMSRCNISALLLLEGFPELEAMDYATYATKDTDSGWIDIPDYDKIALRSAELR